MLQTTDFPTGFLVAMEARDKDLIVARSLGMANVKNLPPELVNWELGGPLKSFFTACKPLAPT
jgi:hypothetical protein